MTCSKVEDTTQTFIAKEEGKSESIHLANTFVGVLGRWATEEWWNEEFRCF
jgi:hypothetical protein